MTSPSTSWKEATDLTTGDASKFGAPDGLNKNNQLFNGDLNVDNVDINSPWFFRTSKCYFLNTAGDFGFLIDSSAAIVADRTLTIGLLTGDDDFVFEDFIQTISSKKIGNWLDSVEIAAPSSPAASEHRNYFDSGTNNFTTKNNAGTVEEYTTNSGTQTITNKTIDADNNTVSNLAIGAALEVSTVLDETEEIWIPAGAFLSSTTSGAEITSRETSVNKLNYTYAGFDTSADESVWFTWTPPENWNAGTVKYTLYWTNTAGLTTETISFDLAATSFTNDDPLDDALGTAITVADTWLAQNDLQITPKSAAMTIEAATTLAAGHEVHFRLLRDVTDDDLTGDADIIGILLEYSVDDIGTT